MSELSKLTSHELSEMKAAEGKIEHMKVNSDNFKIAAVVVTYNRLELLKICIDSLRRQTRKLDEIIIVNNSSTDGTLEWLSKQKDLTVITQENSGSAGGQYTGIKTAYEKGYDWIWCMDDDGNAECNCLENLISCIRIDRDLAVIGSLVRENTNATQLTFGITIKLKDGTYVEIENTEHLRCLVQEGVLLNDYAAFFLGVLINRKVVEIVGLPNKDFFAWGEETEYFLRILKSKLKIATCFNAFFFHPQNNWKTKKWILNRKVYIGELNRKSEYYFRNRAIIASKYNRFYDLRFFVSQISYYSMKLNFKGVVFFVKSYFQGLKLNFLKNV
ncbi:MAG: glycosyltransferase family 2 protein [Ignavibacteria bacterium]|nr:glycosyltransferase family 2 protein [Ignavibacteria bacterium]